MPRVIPTETTEAIDLGDLVEMLETGSFDPRDEANFASWGTALKKLANNRAFLGDTIIKELESRCGKQIETNRYTPKLILLPAGSTNFLISTNTCPPCGDTT